jgi:hypothetical protein
MVSKELRYLTIFAGIGLMILGYYIGVDRTVEIQADYSDNYANQHSTMTTTALVRGNPDGYLLCGVGAVVILGGVLMPSSVGLELFQIKTCGKCSYFGKDKCKKQETYAKARACEDFKE